jgi:hypothetical protein
VAIVVAAIAYPSCALSLPGTPGAPEQPAMFFPMNMFYGGSASSTPQSSEAVTLTISGKVYVDNVPVQGADVTVYVNSVQKAKTRVDQTYSFVLPGVHYGDTIEVMAVYSGLTGKASEDVDSGKMALDVHIARKNPFLSQALNMVPAGDEQTSGQLSAIKAMQSSYQPQYSTPAVSSSWLSPYTQPSAVNGQSNPALSSYDMFVKYSPNMKNIFES